MTPTPVEQAARNTPNHVSVRMAEEFPVLWAMAQEHDFAERLGGCTSALHAEVDRALREIFAARNFLRASSPAPPKVSA